MSTEQLESGYYWIIQKYYHSWEIAWYSKTNKYFKIIGCNETCDADSIDEIDPEPIIRKENE